MSGHNKLEMCSAEMGQAIETYLNEKVFTKEHPCRVLGVTEEGKGMSPVFVIRFQAKVDLEGSGK